MTEASTAILAASITAIGGIASALIGAWLNRRGESTLYPRKKISFWVFAVGGLVVGGLIGLLVGMLILNRPHPSARILASSVQGNVNINQTVSIHYENIPKEYHLWAAVQIPGIGNGRYIYPQSEGNSTAKTGSGTVDLNMVFGGPNDTGRPFTVFVLLADDRANPAFESYVTNCKNDVNRCNGMVMPEEGVQLLDFLPVVRK